MKCKILHRSCGRLRVRAMQSRMSLQQADILEYYLKSMSFVDNAKVYDRTCDIVITYRGDEKNVIEALAGFSYKNCSVALPEHSGRAMTREYQDKLFFAVAGRMVNKILIPYPLRLAITVCKSLPYIRKGVKSLLNRKLDVSVLDAAAVTASILTGDHNTASSIMFMLGIGEILEEWTRKKAVGDLAETMSLNIDKVWLVDGEQEVLVPVNEVRIGDYIMVRTGNMIPLDGKVVSGTATVNQASMTGESIPVPKKAGSYVYAGTVVEEGQCMIEVDKDLGSGRYDRIVKMIEESEKLKSEAQSRAYTLADKLVPYSLGTTLLIYLLTRNVTKAMAVLMVDFSCALKLSMPIAVISAMRESSSNGISVKGGKFLEAVSDADTIVFDKTGTLTRAMPKVAQVITFEGNDENEMLRIAACLEEHYPHSMANAVVEEARIRGIVHEECHSEIEYVVAHGISSIVNGEKVVIGSYHFIFEDEGCVLNDEERDKFNSISGEFSQLYLGISGRLAAVICISDPLREEAAEVLKKLKALGIKKAVMITGDSERTAKAIAAEVGVDEYYSEVLPEDKANFIRSEHEAGRKVIMIGDGVNDSPALSEADAGIAINDGAAIAKEIADITISANDLNSLVTLKQISDGLMKRISSNYRFIISFNAMLIVLGVAGVLPPATSAMLHNLSTLGISLHSMTDLLK